ncbi:MAG TPA: hypothetical protein VLB76_07445 [Thermoanaerobaculia bacterium]|jgi:hypothetical protein|nr:hypothetical protein [Thermoanaerobaculia bacterium]
MKGTFYSLFLLFALLTGLSCVSPAPDPTEGLDEAARGTLSQSIWESSSDSFKFDSCLRYTISMMRARAGKASGPSELLEYYPRWLKKVRACELIYKVDRAASEDLRDRVTLQMAKVLGEETQSFLATQQLSEALGASTKNRPWKDWLESWRTEAIIGIAEVDQALPKE